MSDLTDFYFSSEPFFGDFWMTRLIRVMRKCKPALVHRSQAEERPGAGLKGATQYTPRILMEYPAHRSWAHIGTELRSTVVYVDMAAELRARARVELHLRRRHISDTDVGIRNLCLA